MSKKEPVPELFVASFAEISEAADELTAEYEKRGEQIPDDKQFDRMVWDRIREKRERDIVHAFHEIKNYLRLIQDEAAEIRQSNEEIRRSLSRLYSIDYDLRGIAAKIEKGGNQCEH